MLDALRNKYQSLDGKHSQNIYDPIKHLVSPGYNIEVLRNDHPRTPSNTPECDNDGYLKPNTDSSRSDRIEDNLDHSTYGYLDPVSIVSNSEYFDNYLEPPQIASAFEYTQPYQFSPAGYMAPVSRKHQPYQPEMVDPGFFRKVPYQSQIRAHQANSVPHFPKTPMKMSNLALRENAHLPTPSPWIRQ